MSADTEHLLTTKLTTLTEVAIFARLAKSVEIELAVLRVLIDALDMPDTWWNAREKWTVAQWVKRIGEVQHDCNNHKHKRG